MQMVGVDVYASAPIRLADSRAVEGVGLEKCGAKREAICRAACSAGVAIRNNMPVIAPEMTVPRGGSEELEATRDLSSESVDFPQMGHGAGPNRLVRWAFYLSVFSIPFIRVYLPGSGDKIGITRIVQVLMIG